ncbi:hypothetical protein BKA67DRAFT_641718 [Truncatella angustata]|uniref:Uncharacterized protein n=1 Tax=Truncatella angustata TaxID=152316 RepID=A0A9P8UYS1_9PEZI|nr:uncharacterized protein BKA67DRAFT_641718 [Truncatella angustata]KAH6660653.1 hypothetical protein BKA67DRAFT_641718 [Truncatella angustata]
MPTARVDMTPPREAQLPVVLVIWSCNLWLGHLQLVHSGFRQTMSMTELALESMANKFVTAKEFEEVEARMKSIREVTVRDFSNLQEKREAQEELKFLASP